MNVAAKTVVYSKEYYLFDVYEERFYPIFNNLIIGREKSDISISNSRGTDKKHAKIMLRGNEIFIKDLESKNGTYVNNTNVKKKSVQLSLGAEIKIGNRVFIVTGHDDPLQMGSRFQPQTTWAGIAEKILVVGWQSWKAKTFMMSIIVAPYLFSWFTLRKGFSKLYRIMAFSYLIIFMILLYIADSNYKKGEKNLLPYFKYLKSEKK